jgi:lipopolysaccharide/colanic/teichoic acid biosynthesis glycosyltransferase
MLRVKLQLIFVLIWFAVVFSIDTWILNGQSLDLFVYGLVIALSVLLFGLPALARQNVFLSAAAVALLYLVGYALFGQARPPTLEAILTDGRFLAGGVVVLVSFLLVRLLVNTMESTKAAPPTMLGNTRLHTPLEGEERIGEELYRARRFERASSVVYVSLPPLKPETVKLPPGKPSLKDYGREQLLSAVSALTYKSDIVVDYRDGLIVGLPETDRKGAGIYVNQVCRILQDALNVSPIVGIATYPEEGIVADELIRVAQANAKLYNQEDFSGFAGERKGDLLVEPQERAKIERQAEWVNKLPANTVTTRESYLTVKRAMDIAFVLALMPAVLPVMGIVALLIYLDDREKVFYMQPRTGYGGKRFQMYKFRTMRVGAKSVPPQVVVTSDGTMRYMWPEKVDNDPRITRVGRILRKTSLDELPQLLNILNGDMSLVGPRPTSWNLDMYTAHQTARLTIRPGITGLWQVSARDATNFDERLIWDLKYIEKVSLYLDVRIALMTVLGVFQKSGV